MMTKTKSPIARRSDSETIILGIDPGTNEMGYGIICIKTNPPKASTLEIITIRSYSSPQVSFISDEAPKNI